MDRKLALVELDGVLVDASNRFNHAEQVKQEALKRGMALVSAVDAYWRAAFAATAENVAQDVLMEEPQEALNTFLLQGYSIILLTSRPEAMREVTTAWLAAHDIPTEHPAFFSRLVMKSAAFKYVKTAIWKAGMIETLAALLGAQEILFIDPLISNQQEAQKAGHSVRFSLRVCATLSEALAPPRTN